jgi:hypothetical protein
VAARAEGRVCLPSGPGGGQRCEEVEGLRAYHDHNSGVWREVAWDWGAASDDEVSLLYGSVRGPGLPEQGLFAYAVDEKGVRGIYSPSAVERIGSRAIQVGPRSVDVPTALRFTDTRRGLEVVCSGITEHQSFVQGLEARPLAPLWVAGPLCCNPPTLRRAHDYS